ncbi:MAG: site-specific integrase [Tepidanaerobacteraceae bacterium]
MDEPLIESFLTYLKATKTASQNTVRAYTTDLFQFLEYLKQKKLSEPVLLNANYIHIRGFFALLRERRDLKENYSKKVVCFKKFLQVYGY